jgi:hypothetical protein
MNPNECPLYAGISGVSTNVDEFDFGEGVVLSKTYAHVMAPYLAAFAPAEPGKPHPRPWKAVSGGMSFDIQAEIYLPIDFKLPNCFGRLNTAWWFAALVRLKVSTFATIPVISSKPFAQISSSEDTPHFWPIEMDPFHLVPVDNPRGTINESDLQWIRKHWVTGSRLMNNNDAFNLAFQAMDNCIWSHSSSLALVSLWGGLERLFSPSHYELSFRVSANIASYLELSGEERLACYHRVKKLYDARSKAAHGSPLKENKSLLETYALLKLALVKMIEENHVPSREELESLLFGTG